jgi:hypothetical protein
MYPSTTIMTKKICDQQALFFLFLVVLGIEPRIFSILLYYLCHNSSPFILLFREGIANFPWVASNL